MTDSAKQQSARPRRLRASILKLGVAAATLAFAASLAAIALASSSVAINSASNSSLGEPVLVNSKGRTLYVLTPETTHHLLCKSSECLKFWPPLTVSSSKEKINLGPGVHGHTGVFRRSNGMLQVTLNGQPLYRFAEDRASGEVNGQDLKSFGGVWHVLGDSGAPSSKASANSGTPAPSTPAPTPSPAPSTPSYPGYGY